MTDAPIYKHGLFVNDVLNSPGKQGDPYVLFRPFSFSFSFSFSNMILVKRGGKNRKKISDSAQGVALRLA